ncbi:MAG: hypothetical protein AAGJ93_10575 [Bacteroidota bacterium]
MENELYTVFVEKLEERYGTWQRETSRFGESSFGVIANDLCISKSQFTVLISNKGTEGMYVRSIRNVEQLIKYNQQDLELKKRSSGAKGTSIPNWWWWAMGAAALAISLLGLNQWINLFGADNTFASHPLSAYFDGDSKSNYVSPYIPDRDVQTYCPCSGFEGEWELDQSYIIPLPGRKPGLYYVAKSSDIRMKCQKGVDSASIGKVLIGFENMHNELWLDKKRTSFSPQYFDPITKNYTDAFYQLDMATNPDFIKVCDVYSCFFDQFFLEEENIARSGEPCGRYAKNIDQGIVEEYEIDVEHILKNVISSMAKIECSPAINDYCDPNVLQEGTSILEYDCMFKIRTENLGIGGGYPYAKTYRLVKQNYGDNLLCRCDQE